MRSSRLCVARVGIYSLVVHSAAPNNRDRFMQISTIGRAPTSSSSSSCFPSLCTLPFADFACLPIRSHCFTFSLNPQDQTTKSTTALSSIVYFSSHSSWQTYFFFFSTRISIYDTKRRRVYGRARGVAAAVSQAVFARSRHRSAQEIDDDVLPRKSCALPTDRE